MLSSNQIKELALLGQKKYRQKLNRFLIEGEKLVKDALLAGFPLEYILISSDNINQNIKDIILLSEESKIDVIEISRKKLDKISTVQQAQPVIAIGKIPNSGKTEKVSVKWKRILILDDIQDPGNLGTLLRAADWFDVDGVVLGEGCVDGFNPKVVRSAMGALFHTPIIFNVNLLDFISKIKKEGTAVFATAMTGEPLNEIAHLSDKWAVLLGNEAHGISDKIMGLADFRVGIPGSGMAESLNVAMAGSIVLYQMTQISGHKHE